MRKGLLQHLPANLRWQALKRKDHGVTAARSLGVAVGEDCRLYSGNFSSEPWLIEIGDHVCVSIHVEFITHDATGWLMRDERGARSYHQRIRIGNWVFVGAGAVVLPGVEIGDRCVIGAGTVLTRSVPSGSVVAGSPARIVGQFADLEKRILAEWVDNQTVIDAGLDFRQAVDRFVVPGFKEPLN